MIGLSWGLLAGGLLVLLGICLSVFTAVLARLSGDEVSGWLPVWSNRFLESAVSVVPCCHQDRYREEWKAELAAFRERRLSGLRFAWQLRRRARSVSDALGENNELANVFEPEPPPISARPLDVQAVAEIVRRVVERTRPRDQRRFEDIVEEMREMLRDIENDEVAQRITEEFVGDISEYRRRARSRRLPSPESPKSDSPTGWSSGGPAAWNALTRERVNAMSDIHKPRGLPRLSLAIARLVRSGRKHP